jgi:hypothetical protein
VHVHAALSIAHFKLVSDAHWQEASSACLSVI